MISVKKLFRSVLSLALVLSVLLCSACKKKSSKEDASVSPLFPYYLTENKILSIPNEYRADFADNGLIVQTFFESEMYSKLRAEQCIPKLGDDVGKKYPLFPIDEQGNVLTPDNKLLFLDENGKTIKEFDLNKECGTSLRDRIMRCQGNDCWMITLQADNATGEQKYYLDMIRSDSGLVKHIQLDVDPEMMSIRDIMTSEDGRLALIVYSQGTSSIYSLTEDGNIRETIELPEMAESNVIFHKGQWTCVGIGKDGGTVLFRLDEKSTKWTETAIQTPVFRSLFSHGEHLFGVTTTGITCLDITEPVSLAWEDVSVWGSIQDLRFRENGELELITKQLNDEMLVWYHLSPAEKQDLKKKEEFVIAGYNLEGSCVEQLVQEMNLLHPEVKFILRDYKNEINATEENWAQARNEINTIISLDLANGTAPDMYFDQYADAGLDELGRLGYLKDMTPLISTLDEEEYYVDKITMGAETPYCACLYFDIIGFCASERYVENPYTWTYEDFYRSAKKYPDYSGIQTIFSKQYLLKHGIMAQIDTFIRDGKAYFNSEDFLNLLKWTKDFGCKSNWDDYVSTDLDNGIYMLDWADIVSLGSLFMYQDHVIVGFPNENGSLHVVPYCLLAISASTSQPDLASEIIKYAVGESFQSKSKQLNQGISVNRKYNEEKMQQGYDFVENSGAYRLKYTKEEYLDMYRNLIKRGDHYLHGSQSIVDICLEEAAAYYSGDNTAEHVADMIQRRVTLYLQETDI